MTDMPRAHVLLVDDDELLLHAVVRALRPTQRSVLAASTAEAAGALLTNHEVGVIVGEPRDNRLATFLIEARESHPSVVRVILTGYPDMSSVLKTVNEANPFKLLTKPWIDDELVATVKLAFEQYALNRKRDQLIDEYAGIRARATASNNGRRRGCPAGRTCRAGCCGARWGASAAHEASHFRPRRARLCRAGGCCRHVDRVRAGAAGGTSAGIVLVQVSLRAISERAEKRWNRGWWLFAHESRS